MQHVNDVLAIGPLLRALRLQSKLSARQVALDMNVSLSSLLSWEKGIAVPSTNSLIKVLRFYGETVTIGWDPS